MCTSLVSRIAPRSRIAQNLSWNSSSLRTAKSTCAIRLSTTQYNKSSITIAWRISSWTWQRNTGTSLTLPNSLLSRSEIASDVTTSHTYNRPRSAESSWDTRLVKPDSSRMMIWLAMEVVLSKAERSFRKQARSSCFCIISSLLHGMHSHRMPPRFMILHDSFHEPSIFWAATTSFTFFLHVPRAVAHCTSFLLHGTNNEHAPFQGASDTLIRVCWDLFHFYRMVRRTTKNNYVLNTVSLTTYFHV